jgi:glycosyltransferase involved in cell wall biosynthesis
MIQSVQAQGLTDWELILVDDGSSDGTPGLLRQLATQEPRLRVIEQANAGPTAARNRGFASADPKSKYVIFLDHDDLWPAEALSSMVDHLERNPDVGAVYGQHEFIDPAGKVLADRERSSQIYSIQDGKPVGLSNLKGLGFAEMITACWIRTLGQCLIRREVFAATGGFDVAMGPCSDWDMWIRLSRIRQIDNLATCVLQYRIHPSNLSKNYDHVRDPRVSLYRKYLELTAGVPVEHQIVKAAYPFGMFGFDARLCRLWGLDALGQRRYLQGFRYLARAVRYQLRYYALRYSLAVEHS